MSDSIYRPLIEDMTWSHTRIGCFKDCPYRFYLKYIYGCEETPMFYASYGLFMHKLIEKIYKKEITPKEAQLEFYTDFQNSVEGKRPSASIVNKYIKAGASYFENFTEFPFNPLEVESRMRFVIGGKLFVGILDFLGEKDGELYIVDNKSRDLKPRSKRKKPTLKDAELDDMLEQLYLYAEAVKQKYGKYPKALCFNCFKEQVFIEEPFKKEVMNDVIDKTIRDIEDIANTENFYPQLDYFSCNYICGFCDECEYYEMRREMDDRSRH